MRSTRATLGTIVIGLCLLVSCGCSRSTDGRPDQNTMSPVEYFIKTQVNTMTPNGRIKRNSAESAGTGKIRYQTEDGKKWEVTMTPDEKGYKYSDPKAAE